MYIDVTAPLVLLIVLGAAFGIALVRLARERRLLAALAADMDRLAAGSLAGPVTGAGRPDKFGVVAAGIEALRAQAAQSAQAVRTQDEAQARYQGFFANAVNAYAIHEAIRNVAGEVTDYRFLAVNQAFAVAMKTTAAAVVGRRASDFMSERDLSSFMGIIHGVVSTGQPGWFETRLPMLDRIFETAAFRVGPERFATVFTDVTEARRTQAAESEQRALAEALRDTARALSSTLHLDEVLDIVLADVGRVVPHDTADIILIENGRMRMVGGRGLSPAAVAEIKGSLDGLPVTLPNLVEVLDTGEAVVVADTAGVPGWVQLEPLSWSRSCISAPLRIRDQVAGVLSVHSRTPGFYTDAHAERLQVFADQAGTAVENARLYEQIHRHAESLEHRVAERTEQLSAANRELVAAARLKDEFLATMSHELRSPLNLVLLNAQVLGEGVYGRLSPKQARAIEMIRESGEALLELINHVLDMARLGAGQLTVHLGPVSVPAACEASLHQVAPAALQNRIRLTARYDKRVTLLKSDEERLVQILCGLLGNAIKFNHEGGEAGLEVTGYPERGVARFTVWDSGIGIAETDLPRLFKPFVQLDAGLARHYQGTGLGLAIAGSLAQLLGGSVSVESALGAGSRFALEVPWQPNGCTLAELDADAQAVYESMSRGIGEQQPEE